MEESVKETREPEPIVEHVVTNDVVAEIIDEIIINSVEQSTGPCEQPFCELENTGPIGVQGIAGITGPIGPTGPTEPPAGPTGPTDEQYTYTPSTLLKCVMMTDKEFKIRLTPLENNILMKLLVKCPEFVDFYVHTTLIDVFQVREPTDSATNMNTTVINELATLLKMMYDMLYRSNFAKMKTVQRAEIAGELLKYITHVIVTEKKIVLENEAELLEKFDQHIDIFVSLLKFPKTAREPRYSAWLTPQYPLLCCWRF